MYPNLMYKEKHKYPLGRDGINGRTDVTKFQSPPSKSFPKSYFYSCFIWQDVINNALQFRNSLSYNLGYNGDVDECVDIYEGHTITVIIYKHVYNTSMDERLNRLMHYHSRITIHLCNAGIK